MNKQTLLKPGNSLVLSVLLIIGGLGGAILAVSAGVLGLGYVLSSLAEFLFHAAPISFFHAVLVVLAISCTAGLGIPMVLLARNIQRSTENFSLLQFDDELEEDDSLDLDENDGGDSGEELNEFLKKLHKTRNIGPFIPSPKSMDDLCPCGSGLKYKDCCGKFWV